MMSGGIVYGGGPAVRRQELVRYACECMPSFCDAVDQNGNKDGRVELSEMPHDVERFSALLQGTQTTLEKYHECAAFTEEKRSRTAINTAMDTAVGGAIGGALVGAGAAMFMSGPVGLGLCLGAIMGYAFSLIAFSVGETISMIWDGR